MELIKDGHPTLFGLVAGDIYMEILLWEKRMKPLGIDGGGPNDTTTMRNDQWRTRQPKKLLTLTEMTITVAYDPEVFQTLVDNDIQVNQVCFLKWPDGSYVFFWGWIDSFEPHEVVEGAQPEADLKVCPSNQDDTGVEQPPAYNETGTNPF